MKRRHFLLSGSLLGGGLISGVYINNRGLRYPRMGFEHRAHEFEYQTDNTYLKSDDCIVTGADDTALNLRSFNPEPTITLTTQRRTLTLHFNNISANAVLKVKTEPGANIHEDIDGINRTIEISSPNNRVISTKLQWYLPDADFTFAAIGDTGGDLELNWCISRATQLGAKFLLHLGEFNYKEGEYQRAITKFKQSPIPVYVSVGNHDYNDSGLIYNQFLDNIGPLNHAFSIADVRFVNLDTAVDFFPANSGNRGKLIENLLKDKTKYSDTVVFTHRTIKDPRPNDDHDIGGIGEIDWLCKTIKRLGGNHMLAGHIHRSSEISHKGIRQLTAGEGLGYEDIRHQKQTSNILVGKVSRGQKVSYQWRPLDMPWAMHQSPTHTEKLLKLSDTAKLEWYQLLMESGINVS